MTIKKPLIFQCVWAPRSLVQLKVTAGKYPKTGPNDPGEKMVCSFWILKLPGKCRLLHLGVPLMETRRPEMARKQVAAEKSQGGQATSTQGCLLTPTSISPRKR